MAAIRFDRVSKQFSGSDYEAVQEISMEIEEGALVVLLGPSGCGKTTLLKIVNRLIEPTSGAVYLDGIDIREIEPTQLRRRIGYVIQQVGLFPHLTVSQNISIVPGLLGWDKDRTARRVDELLELVELPPKEFRNRYPAQLSGGQQQRVGVARALAADPDLLLMDEPFGALDAITRSGLQNELARLHKLFKKTILFVTHDVNEALLLADRLAIIRSGVLLQYDTPLSILSHPANSFVFELIGAGDALRVLSQIRVEQVMRDLEGMPPNSAAIEAGESLRTALSQLLRSSAPALSVVKGSQVVGWLTLDDIRDSAGRNISAGKPSSRTRTDPAASG
jgi:osmoprotectant transport system ATP-binding protein